MLDVAIDQEASPLLSLGRLLVMAQVFFLLVWEVLKGESLPPAERARHLIKQNVEDRPRLWMFPFYLVPAQVQLQQAWVALQLDMMPVLVQLSGGEQATSPTMMQPLAPEGMAGVFLLQPQAVPQSAVELELLRIARQAGGDKNESFCVPEQLRGHLVGDLLCIFCTAASVPPRVG